MGKGQHSKDRLFLTATEWREGGGGRKVQIGAGAAGAYRPLPFDSCSLSLTPFTTPVCVPEGHVFEASNVMTWLKKHKTNPVTGSPLAVKELIPLHFHKNAAGDYHCPVTFKLFGPHSHIVALRNTGNVYALEALEELCFKPKNYKDLLTDEPFSKKDDVIVIQDPANPALRDVNQFHFVKANERLPTAAAPTVHISDATRSILEEVEAGAAARKSDAARMGMVPASVSVPTAARDGARNTTMRTSGACAASFTSTDMDVVTESVAAVETVKDKQRTLYTRVKEFRKKGYVQLMTSLGNLNIELHCDLVPKTCDNFVRLCKSGDYDGVKFHRSIPNFMIQGGDPTGSGKGGDSAFGGRFEDEFTPGLSHDGRGVLSMANAGANTNGSQFFILFKDCKHLDRKHSVFGRVVGGLAVLREMESIETDKKDRPLTDIVITGATVFTDPFAEAEASLEAEAAEVTAKFAADVSRKEALVTEARTTAARQALASSSAVGKYMAAGSLKRPRDAADAAEK